MAPRYTWDQLRRLTVPRQFPTVRTSAQGAPRAAALLARIGPVQTQTARSSFLGVAARDPQLDHAAVTAAFEQAAAVRGSMIRGTVHTSTPEHQVLLEAATRLGQRAVWQRAIRSRLLSVEEVWAELAAFATPVWRTPAELAEHLRDFVAARDPQAPGIDPGSGSGRYLGFGSGGLVRRPLSGGWEGQGAAGYRTAVAWVGEQDERRAAACERLRARPATERLDELVALHLRSYGPATRDDVAWWSGLRLRDVDAALTRLAERLVTRPGPDGRVFHDVAEDTPRPREDRGVRLLPEFDAVLCGYHPQARDRFVAPQHHERLWNVRNGLCRAPVVFDGRVVGWWRLLGAGRTRRLEVTVLSGEPHPPTADLAAPAATVGRALQLSIADVAVTGAG